MWIFSILSHPCCFIVYYHLFDDKLVFSGFLQFKGNFVVLQHKFYNTHLIKVSVSVHIQLLLKVLCYPFTAGLTHFVRFWRCYDNKEAIWTSFDLWRLKQKHIQMSALVSAIRAATSSKFFGALQARQDRGTRVDFLLARAYHWEHNSSLRIALCLWSYFISRSIQWQTPPHCIT